MWPSLKLSCEMSFIYMRIKQPFVTSKFFALYLVLKIGWFSNRMGTSVDEGKVRGKDLTRLPVPNLLLYHWSSQLFDLRTPLSSDVPILLLNQSNKAWGNSETTDWRMCRSTKYPYLPDWGYFILDPATQTPQKIPFKRHRFLLNLWSLRTPPLSGISNNVWGGGGCRFSRTT